MGEVISFLLESAVFTMKYRAHVTASYDLPAGFCITQVVRARIKSVVHNDENHLALAACQALQGPYLL